MAEVESTEEDTISFQRRRLAEAKAALEEAKTRVIDEQWALARLLWPHELQDEEPCQYSGWKPWRSCKVCGLAEHNCGIPCQRKQGDQNIYRL